MDSTEISEVTVAQFQMLAQAVVDYVINIALGEKTLALSLLGCAASAVISFKNETNPINARRQADHFADAVRESIEREHPILSNSQNGITATPL